MILDDVLPLIAIAYICTMFITALDLLSVGNYMHAPMAALTSLISRFATF
jgi:hypothetical protein